MTVVSGLARGVDTEQFNPDLPRIYEELGGKDWPRPFWLNVGRVAVEKNLEAFVSLDLPGTKVVVGDGPALEKLARRYPNVSFMGAKHGAELAFSYQGEAFGKRVEPLAASVGSDFLVDVDVTNDASMDAAFAALKDRWGTIDFVIHAIAFADKNELAGRFKDTSRENFKVAMDISCYSFIDVANRAADLMPEGGSIITLSYGGSNRVTPFYNVMGVAKAALESSVRQVAEQIGLASAVTPEQTDVATTSTVAKPEAQAKAE